MRSICGEEVTEPGWEATPTEGSRVAARPDEVRAGLVVARLGERREGVKHHLPGRPELARALVGAGALGNEPMERREAERADEPERREQRRDVPPLAREEPPHAEPEQEPGAEREGQGPAPSDPRNAEGDPQHSAEDQAELGDGRARRAADEVTLEEIVGDGRLDLGAGKERAERRGDRVGEPDGGHLHERDPALEGAGPHARPQHVDSREARWFRPGQESTSTLPSASSGIRRSPSCRGDHRRGVVSRALRGEGPPWPAPARRSRPRTRRSAASAGASVGVRRRV
jgi:hypothetical protein